MKFSYKIFKLVIAVLLLFLPTIITAKNIEIIYPDNNNIIIKINDLTKVIGIKNDYLKIDSKYSYKIQDENFSYDILKLPFALPTKIQKEINILKTITVKNPIRCNINDLQDLIKIKFISKMRDIPISIVEFNPFFEEDEQLKIIDQAEIYISFAEPLQADINDYSFYSNLTNVNQIIFKSISKNSGKRLNIQSKDWYNPNLDYIRFTTTTQGIAKINVSDILNIKPKYTGLPLKFFHLYYKGNERPLKFISQDSILNSDDEIFFLTQIVSGDSTWFNNYTDSAAYYFVYDSTKPGLRLGEFDEHEHGYEEIHSLFISKHLEEDTKYFWGDFNLQWDVENIYREKWIWDDIVADGKDEFKTYFIAYPVDTFNLTINLQSMYFNKSMLSRHKFFVLLNKDTLDINSIDTGRIKEINYKLSKDIVIPGKNELIIKLIPDYDNGNLIIPNKIGIDFIELSYNTKPNISYFDNEYKIFKLPWDDWFFTFIYGFKSDNAYIIDNLNNKFLRKKTSKLIKVSGAVNKKFISYTINGISDYLSGNYFVAINFDSLITKRVFNDFDEVYNYLKTFSENSKFIFISNLKEKIPARLVEILKKFGADDIQNYDENTNWFYFVRNYMSDEIEILKRNELIDFDIRSYSDYFSDNFYHIILPLQGNKQYNLFFADDSNLVDVNISDVKHSNLRNVDRQADVLIISHSNFISTAKRLAVHRKKQGFNVELIDVQDIYKEFNYGIKEPKAIKNFIKYTYYNWKKPAPKFVLLIGDANWDSRNKLEQSLNIDYIPTYGWPPSDYWYSQLDDTPDDIHDVFIGRLPISNNSQLDAIIDKLVEYDTIPKQPWMKKFLSLTGGQNENEIDVFYEDMFTLLFDYWFLSNFSGDTAFIHKQLGEREREANSIISEIDNGAIWVNFLGHGSPQVFDMDGWHVDKLNNKGKYSFFTTISCNTAAFAEPVGNSRDEEYVLIRDKGFIGAGGSTNLGLVIPGLLILGDMLDIMLNSDNRPRFLGEILNNAKIRLMSSDPLTKAFAKQYVLIGDPTTKIRISQSYDLYILNKDVSIATPNNKDIIYEWDSLVTISGILYNNGFCYDDIVSLKLIHQFNDVIDTLEYAINGICFKENFTFNNISIVNQAGRHKVQILIENKDTIYTAYEGEFQVFENGLLPVDPLPYWSVNTTNHTFRMINASNKSNFEYEFKISSIINGKDSIIYHSNSNEINISPTHIDWNFNTDLSKDNVYYLHSKVLNKNTLQSSGWSIIPFTTTDEIINPVFINLKGDLFNTLNLINCALDSNGILQYKTKNLPISLKSSRGKKDTIRLAEIEFNDTLYIITPSESNAPVGINLIVISAKTQQVKSVKYYYTWGDENSPRNLVTFLNDSVNDGDWLALASCGSAWRQFYYTGLNDSTQLGSFHSFKSALSKFGAKKIWDLPDSIDNPYVSYVFVGRKNFIGKTIEEMTLDGSYIHILDSIEFQPYFAKITLPEIYGFDSLLNIKFNGTNIKNNHITLKLFDVNEPIKEEVYNLSENDLSLIDFPLNDSKNISGEIIINREDERQKLNLKNIKIYLIPSSELAIDKEFSKLNNFQVIRGDTVKAYYKTVNLSLRQPSLNISNILLSKMLSGNILFDSSTIDKLDTGFSFIDTLKLSTLLFDELSNLQLRVNNNDSVKEIYNFNNFLNFDLKVLKDSIKPTIEIYSDDVMISDSAFISLKPNLKFLLFDNSYEPLEVEAIKVRFNGASIREDNSLYYSYNNLNKGHLKSQLEIQLDSILDYDNLLEVYFIDAAGNRDTTEYHLFTTINSFIYDEYSYPNPFKEHTIISFKYKSPDNQGKINIKIFNTNGKVIRNLSQGLVVGENAIEFDGKDNYGNKIPSGIYFYFIQVLGPNYSKPTSGKMLKN